MARWDIPSMKKALNDTTNERVIVQCGCGRSAATDTMIDLSILPSSYNLPSFVCGACWFVLQAEGVVTYRQVAELYSAPEEALQRIDKHTQRCFGGKPLTSRHSNKIKQNKDRAIPVVSVKPRKTRP